MRNTNKMLRQYGFILLLSIALISCGKKEKEAVKEQTVTETAEVQKPFFKLSLAQWSLHKAIFAGELSPIDFAQKASELGFDGIEYVSQLYTKELEKGDDPQAAMDNLLKTLKENSETYNVANVLIMVDGEGHLATVNDEERAQTVENHKKWVDAAKYLGCHSIRVNAHGEGTYEEVAEAAVKGLTALSTYAATQGINVLVENHGGYTSNGQWLAEVMSKVNMPNCGTLPDFGNFCMTEGYGSINSKECEDPYDIYKGVEELMPFAKAVSAKSYDFDAEGNQPKIDYAKMLQIVKDAGYEGFVGVEYEGGNLSEIDGINATKALLLKSAEQL
ncbi:sugar phosphate isomerase/epimerase family protein [Lutimonas zeaxanthinifaciens]|uniref:sugar phosphate isomerase/epimerase family protein n=1 Tax=Lutimonas zeaxanthinifaciens TaxID=3060215 RepID=UPI00265CB7B7|nr:sugar phosphate isomerase/epimerase family protein [Lutimonas sp. YSD2104]WKK66973.1 sugar phosphate isomerase/epimerase family protein [Lutimonas sp. YSD2104]